MDKKEYTEIEVNIQDVTTMLFDEDGEEYFYDDGDFVDYYKKLYKEEYLDLDFEDFFERYVPALLVVCDETMLSLDADYIVEYACEELHEDAFDSISYEDIKELQRYLDEWCSKQTGTRTYYPSYDKYVRVERNWFD